MRRKKNIYTITVIPYLNLPVFSNLMYERYLTMSFKSPAGVSGWNLPNLKIRTTASMIIQDVCSGFQMCWQMGNFSLGCGHGHLEVLELGCIWSGRCPGYGACLVWLRDPGVGVQSVGLGVLGIQHS